VEKEEWEACYSRDLMDFAKRKLLDGGTILNDSKGQGTLACLSVRFALEFDLTDRYGREVVQTQIERHMRLCVTATANFEKLITIAGSEPFLAEAARELMFRSNFGAARLLAENSSLSCIDRGRCGEVVAALIIMHACDASSARAVFVSDFMKALLPASAYEKLKTAKLQSWRSGEDKPFYEAFEGYSVWFNHVIKVQDLDMINTKHLWRFITRGAMVMCMDNQLGVNC
jgi:hypothetical protein